MKEEITTTQKIPTPVSPKQSTSTIPFTKVLLIAPGAPRKPKLQRQEGPQNIHNPRVRELFPAQQPG